MTQKLRIEEDLNTHAPGVSWNMGLFPIYTMKLALVWCGGIFFMDLLQGWDITFEEQGENERTRSVASTAARDPMSV